LDATLPKDDDIDFDIPDGFNLTDESPSQMASPETPAESVTEDFDINDLGDLDLPDETAAAETPAVEAASDDFDIGDLGDLDLPDETAAGGTPADEAAEDFDIGDLGDLDLPDETAAGGTPADEAAGDFDIGDLGDLDLPDETAGGETPAEGVTDDFNIDDMDGFGLPDESPADTDVLPHEPIYPAERAAEAEDQPAAEEVTEDFDIGDLGDLDLPEETFGSPPDDEPGDEPAAEEGAQAPDLDSLADFGVPETGVPTGEGGTTDLFDNFDPPTKAAGSAKKPAKASDDDDGGFDFPDLVKVLGGSSKGPTRVEAVPTGKPKGRGWTNPNASLEELEDIQLTDAELDTLQQTLSGYPLNLRVACEEIIAEQVVNPVQMAQLLRLLVRGAHPRATASLASDILGRTITVPRTFEKKTGEALEAEQGTFAYIFIHNFLPVLRLFLFIAVVAGSLFFIIYTFIYKPLKADSIYKLGIERITDGEYQRANERFTEALGIHRKKTWFYKYAEAFRDARQYV
jgi:hypothetical protein